MEPNQGMDNKPNVVANAQDDIVFTNKPRASKGMIAALACAVVLAVGGIGFGVWAMIDGNQKVAKKDEQIAKLNEEVEKRGQTGGEIIDVEVDENYVPDSSNAVNTAGYLYVGEWGLKIKIPENLEVATFMYDYGNGYDVLRVSGATKDGQAIPDFASVSKCVLGVIERYSKANVEAGVVPGWYGEPLMSDDGYSYYYASPQALCTEVESNARWEADTVDSIKSMLTDLGAYSKI